MADSVSKDQLGDAIKLKGNDTLEIGIRELSLNDKRSPFLCLYDDISYQDIYIEGFNFRVTCEKGTKYIDKGDGKNLILGGGYHNDVSNFNYGSKFLKKNNWLLIRKSLTMIEDFDICLRDYLKNKAFCDSYQPKCVEKLEVFQFEKGVFKRTQKKLNPDESTISTFLSKEERTTKCQGKYNFKRNHDQLQKAKNRVPGS